LSYYAVHDRLRRIHGPARNHECVDCGQAAAEWSYDHSCPDERIELRRGRPLPYSLDLTRYQPRCKSCHGTFDADLTPCCKPGCRNKTRRPYMYCSEHVIRALRLSGREFGYREPTDANGRARSVKATATASFTHKVCGRCKVRKPVASFSTRGAEAVHRPDPFKSRCLGCDREVANARYAERTARRAG
jgi:hypothetical protein